ncbi:glycosyltransferase [Arthrobacter sp. zg-Y1143]|uniref:glycosyltransferase n=1 Tax=Arthrobacter sp. zg-Y1143 TaxID=3049065 RepID=UPI0024C4487C|nr:glycosyltransferase [Arthrobacter sp. zg-Y1143]MDK1329048.1 glycosyltransferase [Arthrobacter sp. zg-Y1143]
MTHADEQPAFSVQKALRRQRYAADLDALIADYEELLEGSRQDVQELRLLRTEVRKLRSESARLRADLQASKQEIVRLRQTLTTLRHSLSMRAGKVLALPARAVRKTVRDLRRPVAAGPSVTSPGSATAIAKGAGQDAPDPEELKRSYFGQAEQDPSPENVMRAVAHAHFVTGDVREPAALLRRHKTHESPLGAGEKRTAEMVLGLDRLLDRLPLIPPRQPNAGYLAERGRIMYCAHSTGRFNSNGYSTRTAELTRGLMDSGLDVLVAARPGYPWDAKVDQPAPPAKRFTEHILGVRHVFNPGPSWSEQPLDQYWLEATDIYVREAQRERVEAIHAASNHVTALPALVAARRLGIPFSYEVRGLWEVTEASGKPGWKHSERYLLAERLETFVAVNADIVFAITEEVKDELVRRGVDPANIRILPNGVDTDRFSPLPPSPRLRNKLKVPAGIPVIGYAGSLVRYEGIAHLLESLNLLKQAGTPFRAVIVGDGPELGNLRAQASALNLSELVHFTGRVAATEIPEYVSVFDIVPCPRIRMPVTELVSPLKPLEAMAAGKAVVLTDLPPLRTFAGEDQGRALLARPSDPASLAKTLQILLDDPELRREMGQRARLWTVDSRQWSMLGNSAGDTLKSAISAAAHAAPDGLLLRNMTIGIIADAFTTEGLRPELGLLEVQPESWRTQLENSRIDALLVESAWEGSGGQWRQKVGYYDAERFADLRELLDHCNRNGIPTIFWNKEDPVHFNRFSTTAGFFDHVFTTDADCIRRYGRSAGVHTRTIASLPFYAQPALHNPLPGTRGYSHTVAYAGSYYGNRYPQRSAELTSLLDAARPHGLAIYDRQHLNPDSPYTFPGSLGRYVVGGLPYLEMVEAYKAHPVHINVNSVDGSPTMFSRRVVELAASGTAVLSGKGEGVDQVLAGLVPTVSSQEEAEVLLSRWMNDEKARLDDAWLAYRLIHRGHTAAHRLAYVLRCAGLVVCAPELPRYAVSVGRVTPQVLADLEAQTVRPAAVICTELPANSSLNCLLESEATPDVLEQLGVSWAGSLYPYEGDRTLAEDLLTGTVYGNWSELVAAPARPGDAPGLAAEAAAPDGSPHLVSVRTGNNDGGSKGLLFRRRFPHVAGPSDAASSQNIERRQAKPRNILIAGHDLKFARDIISALRSAGHSVDIDRWAGHQQHDEERSRVLLARADVVFCEWTLGNAAWYAAHILPHQRLVTRFHSQELFTPYLERLKTSAVDRIIFVGRHIAELAVRDHGIPADKALVIPNVVHRQDPALPKAPDARFRLGMVGIVPAQKHLDRALDLLAILRDEDPRYELRIKGKRPEDYPWMADRPEEMDYYQEQYRRMETEPQLQGAVHFDGHDDQMASWYQNIGVALSLSDFESFHLTLADGAVSGAVPASIAWPGADRIYPASWLRPNMSELADYILEATSSEQRWRGLGAAASAWAASNLNEDVTLERIVSTILGDDE